MEMLSLRQEVVKKGKVTFIFILCTGKSLKILLQFQKHNVC